ncbi:WXG100 family type VII secretion target [Nocardia yunnanensis]|uniref:WXG100 family type VII secretion target n=1 Tax=Nocardia yunnanensis TaxID=2382165 RepID=A0A386ZDQ4_9NOCA|nr:WXG100 family type VII secretion target [Nocardia yunnanensis]AYF75497.1 WXG100 family type VII secretion target [Nocardia yunnanensis]
MGDYRVDLGGLQQLIDGAATLEATIESRVAEIESRVDELHLGWAGEAASAHRAAHDERVAAVGVMREALRILGEKLSAAHSAYGTVGTTNSAMWP